MKIEESTMPTLKRRTEKRERRDDFRWLYQSYRWHKFSLQYLKEHRLCAMCLEKGLTEIAKVVDHVIPLVIWVPQGGDPYDTTNMQPLSKKCHSVKTKQENKA